MLSMNCIHCTFKRVVQASGQTEELVIAEEAGMVITVPLGCGLIQSPSGCMYRITCAAAAGIDWIPSYIPIPDLASLSENY